MIACAAAIAIDRLWFSLITHVPGPKLAALTHVYEIYYDIVLGGQSTFKIIELHNTLRRCCLHYFVGGARFESRPLLRSLLDQATGQMEFLCETGIAYILSLLYLSTVD